MDPQYIKEKNIVDRYLAGDLTVREAREFEKFCLAHPEVLQEMPIPVRLKARLSRQPLETSETGMFQTIPSSTTIAATEHAHAKDDSDDDDEPHRSAHVARGSGKGFSYALLFMVALLAAGVVYYGMQARTAKSELQRLKQSVTRTQLQAPSSVQTYKLQLNRSGVPSSPTLALGWMQPAQLLDISINTTELAYSQYRITIQKRDDARLIVLQRVARDSNRDLRISVNSSAFGPGEYVLKIEGYTWRGELQPAGWVSLGLE